MHAREDETLAARLLLLCQTDARRQRIASMAAGLSLVPGAGGRAWQSTVCADAREARRLGAAADALLVDVDAPLQVLEELGPLPCPILAVLHDAVDARILADRVDEVLPARELSPLLLERTLRLCDQQRTLTGRIEYLAQRDVLTGLPNRRLFERQLELALLGAERHDRRIAVGCLAIDGFLELAAELGQARTEQLLIATAERLGASLRRSDLVARAHEDSFLLMLELPGEATDLAIAAEKLLASVSQALVLDGARVRPRASLGMALYPAGGHHAEALLNEARSALAEVQDSGGDDFRFFDAELEVVTRQRRLIEEALPGAIERGELSVRYQPRLDLARMRITGAEVLARWRSPEFGEVSPDRFIPVAEESGAIARVGAWVLRTALADLRRWQDAGHPLHLAVNVSAGQFRREDFAARVRREIGAAGIAPDALELEITERVFVTNVTEHLALFDELTDLGIGFAVDDFGIGYSSLAYLKHFPVHALKIDRAFVGPLPASPEDAAIVRAIVALGHALGLRVVAEGVETQAQLEFLHGAGCDEVQGFLISPGCTPEEFETLLETGVSLATSPVDVGAGPLREAAE
ncbi:MAG: bifunctional diguanylate cyclase/phosphodiesterase [Pseudomonadales bacterium]|nr:bifunctional diguanylate cyclase/phosphodiesterase [Pseudomonadales bacterium]